MPLIYDLSIGKNHMLSVSIILNKKMLHFYEQSWQNQIERILPKGLIQSKCKIFKMIQKMPLSLYIWISIILFISQFSMIYLCFLQSDLNDPILNYPILQNGLVFSLFFCGICTICFGTFELSWGMFCIGSEFIIVLWFGCSSSSEKCIVIMLCQFW
jgi:hypothetical protein